MTKTNSCPYFQFLVEYNNNFSIKYIHLKGHFFGKIDYEAYN